MKFIERLRTKFSILFDELLKRQLALKGICSVDEWKDLKEKIHYDFLEDNNFAEMRDSDLMATRMQIMQQIDPYVGTYFSKLWVKKNILHLSEEDIEKIDAELAEEEAESAAEMANAAKTGSPVAAENAAANAPQPAANANINQAFNNELAK